MVEKRRNLHVDFKAGAGAGWSVRRSVDRAGGPALGVNEGTSGNWRALDRRHRGRGDGDSFVRVRAGGAYLGFGGGMWELTKDQRDLLKRSAAPRVRERWASEMSRRSQPIDFERGERRDPYATVSREHWECTRRGCTSGAGTVMRRSGMRRVAPDGGGDQSGQLLAKQKGR